MLFEKFFSAISNWLPATVVVGDIEALRALDPSKIYVENVRAVLNVSRRSALVICESAVDQGLFERGIEARTDNDVVVATAPDEARLPFEVEINVEDDGFADVVTVPMSQLRKVIYYRLAADAPRTIRPHASAT